MIGVIKGLTYPPERTALLGASIMLTFGVVSVSRWIETGLIYFALLAFRDVLFAFFLVMRKKALAKGTKSDAVFSYFTTFLQLCYVGTETSSVIVLTASSLLSILGFTISTLATIELGTSLGVSPARRGKICATGVYRYMRHPMYIGYAIAEASCMLVNPINIAVYIVSMTCQFVRACIENRVLREGE